jgi:hypothetical protein
MSLLVFFEGSGGSTVPTTITPQIVTVNAQVTTAPAPSTLQQSGALVSYGGTTLATGTYQYCGTAAAVTAILSTAGNYVELGHMATTFFAQGSSVGVYVLELGVQASIPTQITLLGTFVAANPNAFYAYLVPAAWDSANAAAVQTMASAFGSATGKTYFFVTTSSSTIAAYATKAIIATAPSPTAATTEFQAAVIFYQWLANSPSLAAPIGPMNFRFVYGVTPWVLSLSANATAVNTILSAYGNVILTGAEGGISTSLIRNGTTMDGNQAMFWYAVDWILINADRQLSAAVINGSNSNPPVLYNQFGINYLLGILQNLGTTGIAEGLLLAATFTAVPFVTYINANPANYAAGIYGGFACTATPQLGFDSIIFYLNATTFA